MKTFSVWDRLLNIEKMKNQEFDLVIIGGGINGAGIARDAVSRGMSVALVEAHDFASGTSSRSSKLIHGGIRYLENYEFKLVFEALNERTRLFEMAPHLVHPLRFMLPVYKGGRVGMALMGLGMWAYDALSLFQAPEMHEHLDVEESMDRMTALREEDLLGSYVYSDAYMDDDRLVYETLRSAHEQGAVCVSYVKASGAQFAKDGQISAITCEDQITHEKFTIKAQRKGKPPASTRLSAIRGELLLSLAENIRLIVWFRSKLLMLACIFVRLKKRSSLKKQTQVPL